MDAIWIAQINRAEIINRICLESALDKEKLQQNYYFYQLHMRNS